ncbi:methyltransferase [Shewanella spartinae]|uniref:methyltransferase n=1 Tax=Shewanella spartinae TaxID=2864205 RepID=UPI001C65B35D|nr:methyltransferase [Shewanella spartinae]QYJ95445.1 SAM-dependent methyltransferase [Shewanella spartinae]
MSYAKQFTSLDDLLSSSRALWQVKAFEAEALPWQDEFPRLAELLWQLDDEELDSLDSDSIVLHARLAPALEADLAARGIIWPLSLLKTLVAGLAPSDLAPANLAEHSADEACAGLSESELGHFSAHIKGRKWQQILAFAERVTPGDDEILEWCAGKGHLGRLLAKGQSRTVVSLEWQQGLCEAGSQFAHQWQLPQRFVCGDALSESAQQLLKRDQQAVALHACGELHLSLLRGAAKARTRALAVAPCCYHLISDSHYQPLSSLAHKSPLLLSKHDLQLSLQRSVIANAKARALRLKEVAWRLGFDSLQRDVTGNCHYLPIPAVKQSQLSGSFREFCAWAAEQKQVKLPKQWDDQGYLAKGFERQRLTRRIDLAAHLFREALELWLLLDRVCFLQEQGYEVSLGAFCDLEVTPRNGLILARLPSHLLPE